MKSRIDWNRGWQFARQYDSGLLQADAPAQGLETVCLPHTTAETPLQYFDESLYQMDCAYRRVFTPEEEWRGKRVLLTVGAAGHSAWVYLNGALLAEHHCGYTAFQAELTDSLTFGQENVLVIRVDSREDQDIPPFGKVIDYMTFGGLYREVWLEVREQAYLADVFVRTRCAAGEAPALDSQVTVDVGGRRVALEDSDNGLDGFSIRQTLLNGDGTVFQALPPHVLRHETPGAALWDLDSPNLYILRTELYRSGVLWDAREDRFGFRSARFEPDGFYLNGRKLKLRGLDRHQSWPYAGYAMPKSMQRYDADILKYELGVNTVRTSHYPQSHHFIDRCDELGLLVFTELPGWQHIGGEAWQDQAVRNVEEMVEQYRNHPSIVLWGVRINESVDCDPFYRRTNAAAHRLDPTRQTSGVRNFTQSSLLEDVYAYNDFCHYGPNRGCLPRDQVTPHGDKGYLISEYNGHMYPTKSFDAEDRRVEHMLRHVRVMDGYYGESGIAGGIGWCMFDYNTHGDFGSGDRVCYHGVCDQFRNPKLAAAVYASQGAAEPVLEISSSMDVGEHPACQRPDLYAVTNGDSVRLYKGDRLIREFFAKDSPWKNLPHPPILIDDLIGDQLERNEGFDREKSEDVKRLLMAMARRGQTEPTPLELELAELCQARYGVTPEQANGLFAKYMADWGDKAAEYRFECVKDGQVVKTVCKAPMTRGSLRAVCSHTALREEGTYDIAAIRLQAVDERGNVLSFCQEPLLLRTEGAVRLVGPELVSLQGGMGGTYVKTAGKAGQGRLIIQSPLFGETDIEFTVETEIER